MLAPEMALCYSGRLGVGSQVETGGCMVEDGWRLKEELHVGSICQRVEVGRSSRGTLWSIRKMHTCIIVV